MRMTHGWLRKLVNMPFRIAKRSRKLTAITTNDLDADRKLRSDYLAARRLRRKKEK